MSDGTPARVDTVYDLLAHPRRRTLLDVLGTHESAPTVADLARELAIREFDAPIEDVEGDAVERIYLALRHVHVPKLIGADVATYDDRRTAVSLTGRGTRLLARHRGRSDPRRDSLLA